VNSVQDDWETELTINTTGVPVGVSHELEVIGRVAAHPRHVVRGRRLARKRIVEDGGGKCVKGTRIVEDGDVRYATNASSEALYEPAEGYMTSGQSRWLTFGRRASTSALQRLRHEPSAKVAGSFHFVPISRYDAAQVKVSTE
jgi:hypothetical protein